MKILVVSNFYPPYYFGGYELGCKQVVDNLRQRGHDIRVLTSMYGSDLPKSEDRVHRQLDTRIQWPTVASMVPSYVLKECRNQRAFRKLVKKFCPDVVYLWNMQGGCLSLTFVADATQLPVAYFVSDHWIANFKTVDAVYTSLNATHLCRRDQVASFALRQGMRICGCLLPKGLPQPRLVQFCSEYLRSAAVSRSQELRLEGVHWGVDVLAETPSTRCWPPKRWLFVGQIRRDKGVHTAVKGFSMVASRPEFSELTLTLAGLGSVEYENSLRSIAADFGVGDRVHFTGKLSRDEVRQLYFSHDAFIFPSEWPEPFSIALLEAMASGIAVVGTQTGGTSEILTSGETGVTFSAGDPDDCAKAITLLLTNESLFYNVSKAGYAVVQERFTLNAMVDQIEKQLEEIL